MKNQIKRERGETDDMLVAWMRKNGVKLTAENYLVSSGIPAEEYHAERLAEVPRKFRRKIEIMAQQKARRR
jgi:hypothetical protein